MAEHSISPLENKQAEACVVACMLMSADAITEAVQQLKPENFSDDKLRVLFSSIINLYEKAVEVDTVSLCDELRRKGRLKEIGPDFVFQVAGQMAAWQNIGHYCRLVSDRWKLRQLREISSEIVSQTSQQSVEASELLDSIEGRLIAVRDSGIQPTTAPVRDGLQAFSDELEERAKTGKAPGIPTGLRTLDNLTGGLRKQKLIVLAARPGMGKSALALTIANNLASQAKPVASLIISLEMSHEELTERLVSQETGYSTTQFNEPKDLDWTRLNIAFNKLHGVEIYIDDAPTLTLLEIRARARKWKRKAGVGLVVIDYLQLIRAHSKGRTREQEVAEISRSLKALAKELDIPVLALSQLSRGVEHREVKRPGLADLRESGGIEQDADQVWFIYRPWFAGVQVIDGQSTEGLAQILVEKNRSGSTGEVDTQFKAHCFKFVDI